MKKQYKLWSGLATLLLSSQVFGQNQNIEIERYEQARLPLVYKGEAGPLLQQLAQRLKLGFISYEWDINQVVNFQNSQQTTVKNIFSELEKSLSNTHIRFEKVGERLFLIASGRNAQPLLTQVAQEPAQFIGDVVFDENKQQSPETKLEDEATQKFVALASQLTDQNVIAQYKNKKSPQYKVTTKERLGLQNIRVTPLGTFLIFNEDVLATDFEVKGKFENFIANNNIIVFSHRDQKAPAKIDIVDKKGKVLTLRNTIK